MEYALVEPPTDTYRGTFGRPVGTTVIPAKVMAVELPMFQDPLVQSTMSVRVVALVKLPVIRALPDMKALGVPVMGAVVNLISSVSPG
jgi:hypothetical protein